MDSENETPGYADELSVLTEFTHNSSPCFPSPVGFLHRTAQAPSFRCVSVLISTDVLSVVSDGGGAATTCAQEAVGLHFPPSPGSQLDGHFCWHRPELWEAISCLSQAQLTGAIP